MSERVADGRWFRVLTVVNQFTWECLLLLAANLPHAKRRSRRGREEYRDKRSLTSEHIGGLV